MVEPRVGEYVVQAPTRRCTATGRELKTGEKFFGVLRADGPRLTRQDFSAEAWPGPPTDAIAYWAGRVPATDAPPKPRFDDDMSIECLRRLDGCESASQVNLRYVLALLLMRRKRLRLDDERIEAGHSVLVFCDAKTGEPHLVRDPRISAEELQLVQDEVFRLLGWD